MRFDVLQFILFVIITLVIFFGGFFAGVYSYDYYHKWQGQRAVQAWADAFEEQREAEEALKMADTFGGATPQETLQMFIEAVEAGDYTLASRYFVEEKREEWKKRISGFDADDKDWFLGKMLVNDSGSYHGVDEEFYIIESFSDLERQIKYSTINFILYPTNNIWKISSIEPQDF